MASRTASRALRTSLRQAAKAPAVQQRTFVSAVNAASRPALAQAPKAATQFIQQRGVKTVDFAGHKEDVYGMHQRKQRNLSTQWLTLRDRARRLAP
jgi:ketol-acid reductoisomerase